MPRRAGITTRPHERRTEWLREHPIMSNWQVFGPFASLEQAEAWQDLQRTSIRCDAGAEARTESARWWGYWFDS